MSVAGTEQSRRRESAGIKVVRGEDTYSHSRWVGWQEEKED